MTHREVGEIMTYQWRGDPDEPMSWHIVIEAGWPVGPREPIGKIRTIYPGGAQGIGSISSFGGENENWPTDDEIPDHVWAALARWNAKLLLGETS